MIKNPSLTLLVISVLFAGYLLAADLPERMQVFKYVSNDILESVDQNTNCTSSPSFVRQKENTGQYSRFLNNSKWFVVNSTWEGYQGIYGFCNGDSVVNGNVYQKIYRKYIEIPNHWVYPHVPYNKEFLFALLREDIVSRKVYRLISVNKESLLYDFSLNIGDKMHMDTTYQITQIDSIDTRSGKHKRFTFNNRNGRQILWYEGIGNPANTFDSFSRLSTTSEYVQLFCMYQNDSIIYENCRLTEVDCGDFLRQQTALPEVGDQPEMIYPNPTNGKVRITTGTMPVRSVSISDALGRVVQVVSGSYDSPVTEFDLSGYGEGIYFCTLESATGRRVYKVLKKGVD